jgi:transposase
MFGAIELLDCRFHYHRDAVFNAESYLDFLDQLAGHYYPRPVCYIHDNASYHTDQGVGEWFDANESWFSATSLPSYSPELNAAEPLWKYTRKVGTHNRYFATESELAQTVESVFRSIQRAPAQIRGYLQPFL